MAVRLTIPARGRVLTWLVVFGLGVLAPPALLADHLFRLSLMPQPQVKFVGTPGRKILNDGAFAGLATFEVTAPGTYRIATDEPFWIDVVLDGQLVPSKDYQGAPGCKAPRKIVEFELPAAKNLVLQLSGATSTSSLVTITRTPAPKS